MIRVLVCGLVKDVGGLEKIVFDFYNNINVNEFEFEFLLQGEEGIDFSEHSKAISKYPLTVHRIPKLRPHVFSALKEWERFFKENAHRFDVVWSNQNGLTHLEFLRLAKKYGIKKRIIHGHCNTAIGIAKILHEVNRLFVGRYATDCLGCSVEVLDHFYLGKTRKKAKLMNNAIEVEKFLFDESKRYKVRREYAIPEDAFVIGQVGRIVEYNKYQSYSIRIFSEILKKEKHAKLMIVGGGDTSELENLALELGVREDVIFTGVKTDVGEILNTLDVFVYPSKYEGLGIVLVEAQINGLAVVTGTHMPLLAKMNSNYNNSLKLEDSPKIWAEAVFSVRNQGRISQDEVLENVQAKGYDIKKETLKLEKLFKEGL